MNDNGDKHRSTSGLARQKLEYAIAVPSNVDVSLRNSSKSQANESWRNSKSQLSRLIRHKISCILFSSISLRNHSVFHVLLLITCSLELPIDLGLFAPVDDGSEYKSFICIVPMSWGCFRSIDLQCRLELEFLCEVSGRLASQICIANGHLAAFQTFVAFKWMVWAILWLKMAMIERDACFLRRLR